MNFQLDIDIKPLPHRIQLPDNILLVGSCFTENIRNYMHDAGFNTMQNAHGIIFNPISVAQCLTDIIDHKKYTPHDLFYLHEMWHSWLHHSRFSHPEQAICIDTINTAIETQHHFFKTCKYLIITLGSAFAYKLIEKNIYVSNNHRAPQQWFEKKLLSTDVLIPLYRNLIEKIKLFNPDIEIIFTISPVRHIRDGVQENNRSKARLIELVHALLDEDSSLYYFPSYELVIDVLRDYRFYDMDMVHPNYQATQYVWEKFKTHCIDHTCIDTMADIEKLHRAMRHRTVNNKSNAHLKFLQDHLHLTQQLLEKFPYLPLGDVLNYFSTEVQ